MGSPSTFRLCARVYQADKDLCARGERRGGVKLREADGPSNDAAYGRHLDQRRRRPSQVAMQGVNPDEVDDVVSPSGAVGAASSHAQDPLDVQGDFAIERRV